MTEVLSLVLSGIAILIAFGEAVALFFLHRRTARVSEQQLALQQSYNEIREQIAQFELEAHREAAERKGRADIDARYRPGRPEQVVLTNVGGAPARNIAVDIRSGGGESPVPDNTRNQFPIPELQPGQEYKFLVATHMGCSTPFTTTITWTDPDDSPRQKQLLLT